MEKIIASLGKSTIAIEVFYHICDIYANQKNGNTIAVNTQEVAEIVDCSAITVRNSLRRLENANYITMANCGKNNLRVTFLKDLVVALKRNQEELDSFIGKKGKEGIEEMDEYIVPDYGSRLIGKTCDYSIFRIKGDINRDIVTNNKILKKSLFQHGFLSSQPIIIDENGYVIDGQTRLTETIGLSQKVRKPIPGFYFKDTTGIPFDEHVRLINCGAQKKWDDAATLKLYCAKGLEKYIEFRDVITELPYSKLNTRIIIFSHHKTNKDKYNAGDLVGDAQFYREIVTFLKSVKKNSLITRTPFIQSFVYFYENYVPHLTSLQMNRLRDGLGNAKAQPFVKKDFIPYFLHLCGVSGSRINNLIERYGI